MKSEALSTLASVTMETEVDIGVTYQNDIEKLLDGKRKELMATGVEIGTLLFFKFLIFLIDPIGFLVFCFSAEYGRKLYDFCFILLQRRNFYF